MDYTNSVAYFLEFAFLGVVLYLILDDPYSFQWLLLRLQQVQIALMKIQWILQYNPNLPWVRYSIYRNAIRTAKQLQKEYDLNHD